MEVKKICESIWKCIPIHFIQYLFHLLSSMSCITNWTKFSCQLEEHENGSHVIFHRDMYEIYGCRTFTTFSDDSKVRLTTVILS